MVADALSRWRGTPVSYRAPQSHRLIGFEPGAARQSKSDEHRASSAMLRECLCGNPLENHGLNRFLAASTVKVKGETQVIRIDDMESSLRRVLTACAHANCAVPPRWPPRCRYPRSGPRTAR